MQKVLCETIPSKYKGDRSPTPKFILTPSPALAIKDARVVLSVRFGADPQRGPSRAEIQVMDPVTVLLVDDSTAFTAVVTRFLASFPEVRVVGQAESSRQALGQAAALKPALVLMDLNLPDLDGLETTRRLKAAAHAPHVILLTGSNTPEYGAAALASGADGLIFKPDFLTQLPILIERIFGLTLATPGELEPKLRRQHDLNNLLAILAGHADQLLRIADANVGVRTLAQAIKRAADEAVALVHSSSEDEDDESLPTGNETLLLVEDEEVLLTLASHILQGCGYEVLEASSAEVARQRSADFAGPIQLVLCDMVLKKVKGPELVKTLVQSRPEMKVLYLSGYPEEALKAGVCKSGFLAKPFAPRALAVRVREILDQ